LGGRWRLDGNLDAETGGLLSTALGLADSGEGDGEPLRVGAERRAAALGDVCRWFLDHQHTRRGGRHRPHLNLVIDYHQLAAGGPVTGETLDGVAIDPASVSRLLCDGALHRIVMQGRSAVLDYGTATRTIPAPLWNALVIRDRHCRFPGCDRPAPWCEGHHVRHWLHGGPTTPTNLALMCSRHHHLLHQPGWHTKLLPHATIEVTYPDGHTRTTRPPDPGRAPPLPGVA
jgi:Domain of unknown function (DUF222)/HNH endonuclease